MTDNKLLAEIYSDKLRDIYADEWNEVYHWHKEKGTLDDYPDLKVPEEIHNKYATLINDVLIYARNDASQVREFEKNYENIEEFSFPDESKFEHGWGVGLTYLPIIKRKQLEKEKWEKVSSLDEGYAILR